MGKIGIFDSGFGGLTVLKEIRAKLSDYDYIYLGDNARAPYGPKSQELIYEYTKQAVDYLFAHDCELIVLACNTASAEALRKVQQEYLPQKYPNKRVLGVIIPTAEKVVEVGSCKRVGIIATEGTVQSKTYVKEINKLDPSIEVFQSASPLLVPLIEAGELSGPDIDSHLRNYLKPLLNKGIDSLILGCTHYALIEPEIKRVVADVAIFNQSSIVAEKLAAYLERHSEICAKLSTNSQIRYYTTDIGDGFSEFAEEIMRAKIVSDRVVLDA